MRYLTPVKNLSSFPEFDGHRAVFRFEEPSVGLKGFIAIHNENLGPATGGTRMFPYASEADALRDVLRLSRAMTYKCALAGVRHGGGKAVIIGDPEKDKNDMLIRAYARIVGELKGKFFTGEDVGISEDDVQIMLQESDGFIGKRGVAGDPSPYAALSVFSTMQVAIEERFENSELFAKTVAIKGIGKVGGELFRLLTNAGAVVSIAEIKPQIVDAILSAHPRTKVIAPQEIHKEQVDIFSPCALSDDITEENINEFGASIICGGANNQLKSEKAGEKLFKEGMLYVPDYVANAGGLINVVDELETGGYNRKRVLQRIENLKNTLRTIYLISRHKKHPPNTVTDRLAEEVFRNGNGGKTVV